MRSGTRLPAREVPGHRAPNDGDVDLAVSERVHDAGWRIRAPVIRLEVIAAHVADYVPARQSVRGRSIGAVVSDQLHADAHATQHRVVKRSHASAVVARVS